MGNTPCTVGLRVDRSAYNAGQTITGIIYLSVTTKPQPASSLNLRLKGEEATTVHHTTTETDTDRHGHNRHGHNRTRHHYERSSQIFYSVEYPISKFPNGHIQPGQYEFPFQVALPPDLPGTMSCTQGESHSDIRYEMEAVVVRRGAIFTSAPNATKSLRVVAAPPTNTELVGVVVPPEVIPVKSCCCFGGNGTMTLSSQVDKGIMSPNEPIYVGFSCKNDSTVKVRTVQVKLEEVVEWSANGCTERFCRNLDKRVLGGSEEMPELRQLDRARPKQFGSPPGGCENLVDQLPQRSAQLVVPADARDTYQGSLINVRHILTVMLVTKGGCCTTSPESSVLVRVQRRSATESNPFENPPAYVPVEPSAPPEESVFLSPSAPPYENNQGDLPEAEVILPADWHAQRADVVAVPLAKATLLDPARGEFS